MKHSQYFTLALLPLRVATGPQAQQTPASGREDNYKLSNILAALEPYKKYINAFANLENAAKQGFAGV
jgi:hypothetical protein